MSAPRIDTFRNTLDATILRLAELWDETHDIHDLAYNRTRAADEARVNGGSRDFALDTNGDMVARRLYIDVARDVVEHAGVVEDSIGRIRSHLTSGSAVSTYDRSAAVPRHEVAAAITAAGRRRQRGEFSPHLIARPAPLAYIEPTVELENLRAAVRKMAPGQKPDRSRLTPAEQDAWRRCSPPAEKTA